jgi:hypothetical protein
MRCFRRCCLISYECEAEEAIEEVALGEGQTKELTLVVDHTSKEERIVTVYEPDPDRWSTDFRRRR